MFFDMASTARPNAWVWLRSQNTILGLAIEPDPIELGLAAKPHPIA